MSLLSVLGIALVSSMFSGMHRRDRNNPFNDVVLSWTDLDNDIYRFFFLHTASVDQKSRHNRTVFGSHYLRSLGASSVTPLRFVQTV